MEAHLVLAATLSSADPTPTVAEPHFLPILDAKGHAALMFHAGVEKLQGLLPLLLL